MSLQTSGIREELVHHFNAALGYAGACTQHQREDAHYQSGRKDGLGLALELVDTFLFTEDGHPGRRRPVEEIVASVTAFEPAAGRGCRSSGVVAPRRPALAPVSTKDPQTRLSDSA